MKGRILIDVPQTGHKSGDYADLDEKTASILIEICAFDPAAPWPVDEQAPKKRIQRPSTKKQT